jgi:hypothetical protein
MTQVLAWICLVLVACTTAYGLQLTAAAIVPPASAADRGAPVTSTRRVLILVDNPVTGESARVECDVPTSSYVSDVFLVDANDLPVVALACNIADAPPVHP